jgi:polyisoprenoid-binding protein YceI
VNPTRRKIMKISALKFATGSAAVLGVTLFLTATAVPPPTRLTPSNQQSVAAPANEVVLMLDPAQSQVHYTVDSTLHTVHGTFSLKSGALHYDPRTGKAAGEIVVDARMHKEILETPKFPEAVFRPTQIEGQVNSSGASDIKLQGIFTLHGADHDLTAQVHANLTSVQWTATAKFDVPYISWGLRDPSNFLLKVKPVVNVELDVSGPIQQAK